MRGRRDGKQHLLEANATWACPRPLKLCNPVTQGREQTFGHEQNRSETRCVEPKASLLRSERYGQANGFAVELDLRRSPFQPTQRTARYYREPRTNPDEARIDHMRFAIALTPDRSRLPSCKPTACWRLRPTNRIGCRPKCLCNRKSNTAFLW